MERANGSVQALEQKRSSNDHPVRLPEISVRNRSSSMDQQLAPKDEYLSARNDKLRNPVNFSQIDYKNESILQPLRIDHKNHHTLNTERHSREREPNPNIGRLNK